MFSRREIGRKKLYYIAALLPEDNITMILISIVTQHRVKCITRLKF